jgi:malonyl-CoA O-methyltransferase
VNDFTDMHDVGDLLLNTQFDAPVIDMEMLTVSYNNVKDLLKDLKATGAHTVQGARFQGFTTKRTLQAMIKAYETFKQADGRYPATFEVIYGHAVKLEKHTYRQDSEGVIRIPADKIPRLNSMSG